MRHRRDSTRWPQPRALMLANLLGEHQLLVPGGVLAQPAGDYYAARQASYLNGLLDTEGRATAEVPVTDLLNERELIDLAELRKIRLEINEE